MNRSTSLKNEPSVLLVEDNPVNQKLALILFKALGQTVQIAGSGEEAIAFLQKHPYKLLIMDIQLPGMDGVQTAEKIREEWGDKAPPIVALTAGGYEEEKKRYLKAGMQDSLLKPISKKQLEEVLQRWL